MDYAHYSFLSYLSEVWLVGINDTKQYMKKMEKKNILNMANISVKMYIKVFYIHLQFLYVVLLHLDRYNKLKENHITQYTPLRSFA